MQTYKEFLKELNNNSHFEDLLSGIEEKILSSIKSSKIDEKERRESLYFSLQGVKEVRNTVKLGGK